MTLDKRYDFERIVLECSYYGMNFDATILINHEAKNFWVLKTEPNVNGGVPFKISFTDLLNFTEIQTIDQGNVCEAITRFITEQRQFNLR